MCRIEIHGCVFVCSPSGDHPFIGRQALFYCGRKIFETLTPAQTLTTFGSIMPTQITFRSYSHQSASLWSWRNREAGTKKRTHLPSLPWDVPETRPSSLFPKLVFMVYTTPPPSLHPSKLKVSSSSYFCSNRHLLSIHSERSSIIKRKLPDN